MVSPSKITVNSNPQVFLLTHIKGVPYSKIGGTVVEDLTENHITLDFPTLTCTLLVAIHLARELKSLHKKS